MATMNQIYAIVNASAKEAIGTEAIAVKDTATLVALGDTVLSSSTNKEQFYKALTDRIGKTVIAVREYNAIKRAVKRDEMEWGIALQKISYKFHEASANAAWDFTTQANPFDVEPQTEAIQKLFSVMSTYSFEDSLPDGQLFTAFTSGSAMGAFISGIYTNMKNAMEIADENMANLAVATNIGGVLLKGGVAQKRNLLAEYNAAHTGATLTVDNCLESAEFLKYATREIATVTKNITKMSTVYNADAMPRFTSKDKQVVEILGLFASAQAAYLQADTYHKELVSLPNYEEVVYWQGEGQDGFVFDDVSAINIKNSHLAVEGNPTGAVSQSGIIAFVHDVDSCASIIMKRRSASIYNPRAERYNIFEKADQGYAVDLSENAVVFYIA